MDGGSLSRASIDLGGDGGDVGRCGGCIHVYPAQSDHHSQVTSHACHVSGTIHRHSKNDATGLPRGAKTYRGSADADGTWLSRSVPPLVSRTGQAQRSHYETRPRSPSLILITSGGAWTQAWHVQLRLSRCESKEAPCCLSTVGCIPALPRTGQAPFSASGGPTPADEASFSHAYSPCVVAASCCPSGFGMPGMSRPLPPGAAFLCLPERA